MFNWARKYPAFQKAIQDGLAQQPRKSAWNREHGLRARPEFGVWAAMRRRCFNPNVRGYADYGGRGITVCDRWAKFIHFWDDMGPRPAGCELDRIDNGGNYEPGNCHWVPRSVQAKNKRNNRWLTANGETKILTDWARDLGIEPSAILHRLRAGWSEHDAVTTPRTPQGGGATV